MPAAAPWWHAFPTLKAIQDPRWGALMSNAREVSIPPGTSVFHAGDACRNFLFVLDGSVRVEKIGENGREIVLYRVGSGETCLLTTSCLIAKERYPAEGVTETAVRAVALPDELFNEALALSSEFRGFVFTSFGARLTELMALVEAITFGRGDARLARRLLESDATSGEVVATHQQLAAELGTAREVVSRFLKEFERRGLVRLARGHIVIADRAALQALAATL
ncbi:MAG TPA: Crp/Fnr family transcriptional regulator [Candidatus Methylomirabilis sp.]|nr:Crp/Fnr family transcriptional regulator [Candidatus Methylomirabilis sp.]